MVTVRGRTAVQRLSDLARDREPLVRAAAVRELARRRGVAAAAAALTACARDDADPIVRGQRLGDLLNPAQPGGAFLREIY